MSNLRSYNPAETMLGGFSSLDGTIEFYSRVGALLEPHFKVLDLGAGRGAWFYDDKSQYRRDLRDIRSKVAEYIGADVDQVVVTNPTTTRNTLICNEVLPVGDGEIDLIVCDYVLEHVKNIEVFRNEVSRVLKSGGYFCGRTPHTLNYVSLMARLVRNTHHTNWLRRIQPGRKSKDVFPTFYRCNTLKKLSKVFEGWEHYSYLYSSEPQYYFGNMLLFRVFSWLHKFAPLSLTGNLFIFIRKPLE